jgi:hypothetical protein
MIVDSKETISKRSLKFVAQKRSVFKTIIILYFGAYKNGVLMLLGIRLLHFVAIEECLLFIKRRSNKARAL